jgi:type III pantothenate kinase
VQTIDKEGRFLGVNISPGLLMRLKALHQHTDALPLIHLEQEEKVPDMGTDTRGAIVAGVVQGIVHEVEGYIAKNQDKKIILTGGDALFFAKQLKTPIFVDCNLIFMGLAEIAQSYA